MLRKDYFKQIDWYLILCMIVLTAIGMLAISSATAYSGDHDILTKQLIFFICGLVLMIIVMNIDYHLLGEWYLFIYIGILIMLVLVFFLGSAKNGAARWIEIGPIQIQPSEFAKVGMILCTAKLIDRYEKDINALWPILIIGLFDFIPFLLIKLQPNLSTSIVFITILMIQLFVTRLDMRYILISLGVGILVVTSVFVYIVKNPNQRIIKEYQRDRIVDKINGGNNLAERYQTNQAIHAIGSGGIKGKGLYQGSISQLNYLPESHNDFIIAVIGEEFGFFGILLVIGMLLLLIARGLWIARAAPDTLGTLIVVGYIGMITVQSFVNIGVVTDILPNTGIPIPFISYGGSSLWANMIGMGLVLNVAMRKENTMF